MTIALACLGAAPYGAEALAQDSDSAAPGHLRDLETPQSGQRLSFPGDNSREVALPPENAFDAGTPGFERLSFEVRLSRRPKSPIRMAFHIQNHQGWYYQTTSLWAVPETRWRRIDLDFSPDSGEWEAAGHGRPWNAGSARGITRVGLRLFCETESTSIFHLRAVSWEKTGNQEPVCSASIVDFREPRGSIGTGRLWEIAFRASTQIRNPFEPTESEFLCEIVTPEGKRTSTRCFIYQDYVESGDHLVAAGSPQWRARYRPETEGRYRYRLRQSFLEERRSLLAAEGWFNAVREPEDAPTGGDAAAPTVSPDLHEFILDLTTHSSSGWRPELAPRIATWLGAAFKRGPEASPERVWRPMIEWTRRWGHWEGLGTYDLELAWRFDRALEEAERAGISMPYAILDDGPFLDHGTYRWPLNPLAQDDGGPLAGPGEFFTSAEARHYFLQKLRYAVARFGHSPAVESWCIASGLAAPGAVEWHERVGQEAAALGVGGEAGKPLIALHPFAAPFREEMDLGEFERGREAGWHIDATDSPGATVSRVAEGAGGGSALAIGFPPSPPTAGQTSPNQNDTHAEGPPVPGSPPPAGPAIPKTAHPHLTAMRSLDDNLFGYDYLTLDLKMPEKAESVGRAQVIVRDRDLLWYEYLLETPLRPGDWTRCVVDLSTSGDRFKPVNHHRSWSGHTRSRIRQLAVRVFPNGAPKGEVLLDHVRLYAKPRETERPIEIRIVEPGPKEIGTYDKYEMVLDLSEEFSNPFDPDEVALDVTFAKEGFGKKTVVPGFFYEPYSRRLEKKRVREYQGEHREVDVDREVEMLDVAGAPDWRVRFAPAEVGTYTTTIRVKTPTQDVRVDGPTFTCSKSATKGYIQVAADNQYFEHATGEVYYPIGPVIRSPNDVRDLERDPKIREDVLKAGWRGTFQFDEYFDALGRSRSNWIRMWMCSWWCGLEWYHQWPGYGGTGIYNLPNAWRMDHVIDTAQRKGVYVQLCLQNHGQTSILIDHEWEYHPYNKYLPEGFENKDVKDKEVKLTPAAERNEPRVLRPGGWLTHPREFYSDRRAIAQRKKLYRYVIARWGYSPNVLAWVLSSELDFTGEYWETQYGRDDHDMKGDWPKGEDRAVNTLNWHKEMARYIRQIDGGRHMITTHFSHPHRGRNIWRLDELSYAQSNAYSAFAHMGWFQSKTRTPSGCVPVPVAMTQYYNRFLGTYGKPVLVVEWGGHWMRNSKEFLEAELHTGTWASIMTPMAGTTGFWWWSHVHFNDGYGVYTAVARFLEAEDRRGLKLRPIEAIFEPGHGKLNAVTLGNDQRADVYVYDTDYTADLRSPGKVEGITLVVPGLRQGRYLVETWDTIQGKMTGAAVAFSLGGALRFELPDVRGDLALKIRPVK
jgi:hypothetical protein